MSWLIHGDPSAYIMDLHSALLWCAILLLLLLSGATRLFSVVLSACRIAVELLAALALSAVPLRRCVAMRCSYYFLYTAGD
jgi:hypothetical protein